MNTTSLLPLGPALLLVIIGAAFIGAALGRRTARRAVVQTREAPLSGLVAVIRGIIATIFLAGLAVGMGALVSLKLLPHLGLARPGQQMAPPSARHDSALPLGPIAEQLGTIERDLEHQVERIGHLGRDGVAVGPALDELRKRIQADRQYIEYLLKQNELTRTDRAFRQAAAEAEARLRQGMERLRSLERDVETQKRQAEMMARRAYESALRSPATPAPSSDTETESVVPPPELEAPGPAPAAGTERAPETEPESQNRQ